MIPELGCRMKASICGPFHQNALEILKGYFEIQFCSCSFTGKLSEQELIDAVRDVHVLIISDESVSAKVIEAGKDLEVIAVQRSGYVEKIVDVEAATKRGILVLYAPERNADAVADFTFGLILAEARGIARAHALLKAGKGWWYESAIEERSAQAHKLMGPELPGKTIGIVGLGAIGYRVAKRAIGFGMRILYNDIIRKTDIEKELGIKYVDLENLLRESDFVTVHTMLTPETRGLIGAEQLAMMKPMAFLINASRGAILDQQALYETLKDRKIAGAALDVFEEEPIDPNAPILALDNVTVTPHIGGASIEVLLRGSLVLAEDIERFLKGERPRFVANPSVLERQAF